MMLYGGRWLGLYSRHDEAIGELKRSTSLYEKYIPIPRPNYPLFKEIRDMNTEVLFLKTSIGVTLSAGAKLSFYDELLRIIYMKIERKSLVGKLGQKLLNVYVNFARLYTILLFALRNLIYFMPVTIFGNAYAILGNRFIWTQVRNKIQGNDNPLLRVSQITVGPLPVSAPSAYPPLSEVIDDQLVDKANQAAVKAIPQLRQVLAQTALSGGDVQGMLDGLAKELSWKELVHTSYFEHPSVVDLLCLHVEASNHDWNIEHLSCDPLLVDWYVQFRKNIREKILDMLDSGGP